MKTEISEDRRRLADLVTRRATILAKLDEIAARRGRLAALDSAVSPAESELSALESRETAAMAEWSRDPAGKPPAPDIAARERLRRAIEMARAASASASRARDALAAEERRENADMSPLWNAIWLLGHEIAAAEILEPMAREISETEAKLAFLRARLRNGREHVLQVAERAPDLAAMTPLLRVVGRIDSAPKMPAHPILPDDSSWHNEFVEFIARLQTDPTATLAAEKAAAAKVDESERLERARRGWFAKAAVKLSGVEAA